MDNSIQAQKGRFPLAPKADFEKTLDGIPVPPHLLLFDMRLAMISLTADSAKPVEIRKDCGCVKAVRTPNNIAMNPAIMTLTAT